MNRQFFNSFKFEPMTEACARAVLSWRYEPPYDFYNQDLAQLDVLLFKSYLNPAYHYFSVFDEQDSLIAFRCLGEDAQVPGGDYSADALDMGGGLRPDLTGHGLGPQVMRAAMDFARAEFSPKAFRTTVAEFNLRAQRACQKVGYVPVQRFFATHSGVPFVIFFQPDVR
jgi:[ribosomal protein S18]-alanine N-acetyltransferase